MKKHLVVGLGNVGESYFDTRHNIGFDIINFFVQKHDKNFSEERYGKVCDLKIVTKCRDNSSFLQMKQLGGRKLSSVGHPSSQWP